MKSQSTHLSSHLSSEAVSKLAAALTIALTGTAKAAPVDSGLTLVELCNEYLTSKARGGRSERYLRQMRCVFLSFGKGRSRMPAGQVTLDDIEAWLHDQHWSARTISGNLSAIRSLYAWGQRRGLVSHNPAHGAEVPSGGNERPILVHSPQEVRTVLDTAAAQDLDVLRHLAVRYFAGLRSAEAHRIRESDILHEDGVILISASNSKTRSRRLVTISPNLRAWLNLGGTLRAISPNTVKAVVKLSGVTWPHNVTRHSFVSYHLAAGSNAAKTAVEAGHAEAVLFRHYRALVTKKQADEFWNVGPNGKCLGQSTQP